jgi:hypothetical protein
MRFSGIFIVLLSEPEAPTKSARTIAISALRAGGALPLSGNAAILADVASVL